MVVDACPLVFFLAIWGEDNLGELNSALCSVCVHICCGRVIFVGMCCMGRLGCERTLILGCVLHWRDHSALFVVMGGALSSFL